MTSVRQLSELDPLERLALIDISYSRLDTYSSCSAKYFYTYVLKEERTFGAAAALGNIVHGVLEHSEELSALEMHQLMEEQRKIYDPEGQISLDLMSAGWRMLLEFADRHATDRPNILGRETEFHIVLGSALINGFIDRVERAPDGMVRVTDWKSGTWETRVKPADNIQLGLYALVASKLFGVDEVYAELYYLRSGRRPGHLFTQEDLIAVEEKVIDMINKILTDRHFHPTDNEHTCRSLCDHGKSGVCVVGKARQR